MGGRAQGVLGGRGSGRAWAGGSGSVLGLQLYSWGQTIISPTVLLETWSEERTPSNFV